MLKTTIKQQSFNQICNLRAGMVTAIAFCLLCSLSCNHTPTPEKRELSNEFYENLLIAFTARDYDLVKNGLQKIEEAGIENKRTYYLKAMVALNEQNPERAITALKAALVFDPKYGEAHNTLGSIYMQQKLLATAETEFLKAANNALYQTPEKAYQNLGKLYQLQNKEGQAQQCYRKAIELNQDYFPSHYELSQLYFKINKFEEAYQEIERARTISPEHPGVWLQLGKIEKARQNQEQARQAFKQTIKLQPLGFFEKQANQELNLLK
jgi:type IV pilus assembly protein PilF